MAAPSASVSKLELRLQQLEREINNAKLKAQQNTSLDKYELLWDFEELIAPLPKVRDAHDPSSGASCITRPV